MGFPVEPSNHNTASIVAIVAATAGASIFAAAALLAGAGDASPGVRAALGGAVVLLVAGAVATAIRFVHRARAAERELQGLRQRWTDFLAVSADWYWEMDAELRFTYFSDNVEAVTGSQIKSVVGRTRADITDEATRSTETWRKHCEDMAARRPFRGFSYTHRRADGETRHFQISGDPVFAADGRFLGYRGSGRDVTDLARAETRVVEAIESMQDGFIVWDAQDRVVMCNSAIARSDPTAGEDFAIGRTFEEVMRRRVAAGKVPGARGREDAYFADRLASHRAADGKPIVVELADGRWVEIIERRTLDGGIVSIRRDVSDIKRREAELLRAESRLADAIESMPDGFLLWGPDERLIVCNSAATKVDPAAAGLLKPGISFEEFLLARTERGPVVMAPVARDAYIRELLEGFRSGRSDSKIVQQADGRWVRVSISRTREGGVVSIRQDITEEKERQVELQRAQSRLDDAIESMPDGLLLWGPDERLIVCNSATKRIDPDAYEILKPGIKFEEFLRARVARGSIVQASENQEQFIRDRLEGFRSGQPAPIVQQQADGRWLRITQSRTREGGVVSIRADITAEKRREDELRQAETRLHDAIESLTDGVALWDANDRLVMWNSAADREDTVLYGPFVVGTRYEDMLRRRVGSGRILQARGREEEFIAERMAARHQQTPPSITQQLDTGRWMRITHHRTRDGGLVSVRQDITETKAREAELLRAESRLTDAIEALSDSFVLWDADDRLVMWNSASERIEPESGRILSAGMLYEDYMRARIAEGRFLDAIGREEEYLAERLAQRRAGSGHPVLQRLSNGMWLRLSEHRTRDGGVVVIRSDVTETKMREAELLRAKNQAEAANVAKSQFLATMSHELRTPLNAIIGFSDMLISQVYGPLGSPRYAGYAQDIHASGQHLLALITDILDMSRIEAGRYEFRPETVALADLVEESLRMVRGRAEEHGIRLAPVIEPGISTLWADRRALKQILLNLLSNAVKFTRDGGRVTLSAAPTAAGGIAIAVADSGVGIDAARLARIFEPFQHINASVARSAEGTGLGLSICKRLADLHGATISIASTVGRGTTVTVVFPPSREGAANAA